MVAEWHEADIGEHNPYIRSLYGAFTFNDVLNMLPKEIKLNDTTYYLFIDYQVKRVAYGFIGKYCTGWLSPIFSFSDSSLLDALYKMLVWCIENGYVKTI